MPIRFMSGGGIFNIGARGGGGVSASGGGALPYSIDFSTLSDGALPSPWSGATWTIASGKAINTPALATTGGPLNDGNLLTNADMAVDEPPGTAWTKAATWSIASGVATHTAGASGGMKQNVLTIGKWYAVGFTIAARTAGTVNIYSNVNVGPVMSTPASYVQTLLADAAACGFWASADLAGSIDNVSAKEITLSSMFTTSNFGNANVTAQVPIIRVAGTKTGMVLNLNSQSSPSNFVIAYLDGLGNAKLDKCVNGTLSTVITGAVTYGANKVLKVVKGSDNHYELWYGTAGSLAQVGTNQTISDATIISNTYHGLFSTYSGNQFGSYSVNFT